MRVVARVILIFAGSGAMGPLIWFATKPPSLAYILPPSAWFFYTDLVELLWPVSMMGPWIGVPANLVLFAILGFGVTLVARVPKGIAVAYVAVAGLLFFMALWVAGFRFAGFDWLALAVALPLYAIPFFAAMRALNANLPTTT